MSGFVTHPMLHPEVVEARAYQLKALNSVLDASTLLVLPTGMGKTPIEFMAVADRLHATNLKVILVAPTNPLVEQHYRDAQNFLSLDDDGAIVRVNGSITWQKREQLMQDSRLIIATPQVIRNDVQRGVLSLADVGMLILDEGHHASGNHAMAQVADLYHQQALNGLLLAATASPGSTEPAITNLVQRLDVHRIISMRRDEPMLAVHAVELEQNIVELEVCDELRELAAPLEAWLERMVETLRRGGVYVQQGVITSGGLNDARQRASRLIAAERRDAWKMATCVADCSRILTLVNLLLCQGINTARSYIQRNTKERQKSKKLARFIDSAEIGILRNKIKEMHEIHAKVPQTKELVTEQLNMDGKSRVIVFATLRDSVNSLARSLNSVPDVIAEPFIGQSSRGGEGGMSQKEQIAALDRFRAGECNVLVATSVGEEGLDVPSADRVIFYEPVASEIRTIQRRGRTGRHREGFVYTLVAKGTKDEGIRYASRARELRMHRVLNRVKSQRDLVSRLTPPIDRLTDFSVDFEGVPMSAIRFAEQEIERLNAAAENRRIEESKEKGSASTEEVDSQMSIPKKPTASLAERLRPSGQSGLDAYIEMGIEEEGDIIDEVNSKVDESEQ